MKNRNSLTRIEVPSACSLRVSFVIETIFVAEEALQRPRRMSSAKENAAVRQKGAFFNQREYEDAKMHNRMNAICASIHKRDEEELGFRPDDVTNKSLSILTGALRAFVESALGRHADPKHRRLTKFPHKLFFDFRPTGALQVMLCTCLRFKATHGLRRLDFLNTDKRQMYLDLLRLIEKNLRQAGLLPPVKVFITRFVPTSAHPVLRAVIQKRGITVSTASSATHIIYPDPKGTTKGETEGTEYCRTLEIRDSLALVHWWYYPDSYDSWIQEDDVQGDPEPNEEHEGPWHVQMRWLQDTDLFNEWMNEIDYEVPEESWIKVIPPPPRVESAELQASKVESQGKVSTEKPPGITKRAAKKRKRISAPGENVSGRGQDLILGEDEREGASSKRPEVQFNVEGKSGNRAASQSMQQGQLRKLKEDSGHQGATAADRTRPNSDTAVAVHSAQQMSSPRKRPRTTAGDVQGVGKRPDVSGGIKVRLCLKAPLSRTLQREAARKGEKYQGGNDRKYSVSDTDEKKKAIKVRVRLARHRDGASTGGHENETIKRRVEDSPRQSVESTLGEEQDQKRILSRSKTVQGGDGSGESGSLRNDTQHGAAKGSPNLTLGKESAEDQTKAKTPRKERRPQLRVPGVSFVENATPIREADVTRIRNISLEGEEHGAGQTRVVKMESSDGADNEKIDVKEKAVEKKVTPKVEKGTEEDNLRSGENDSSFMDTSCDNLEADGEIRVRAITQQGLMGDSGGAPTSGADICEALPSASLRIPAHASWFSVDAVHDIEKRSLPEFFNGTSASKTPKVYKIYRDFMIDTWRQNCDKYLTATAARRHLAGDVCAILRVHAFLEHWGLINYGAIPESRPHYNIASGPLSWRPKPMQVDRVFSQGKGIPRLLFFDDPKPSQTDANPVTLQRAISSAKEKHSALIPLATRHELYATAATTKHECDACGVDCSKMRYSCVGSADVELCPSCFANGRYPSTLSSRDFEQLTTVLSSEAYDGSVWSEAEELLLLEGLEKFGDDWNAVAAHVHTKSARQCVLQFLRMPIEDSFLGDQVGKWRSADGALGKLLDSSEGSTQSTNPFVGPSLPFADAANPIMAQVAFLASSVSPEVAAAAAQAALAKIMSDTVVSHKPAQEANVNVASTLLRGGASEKKVPCPADATNGPGVPTNRVVAGTGTAELKPIAELDHAAVEAAAAVGLGAAAARAKKLAEAEVRDMERSFAVAIESKLKAIEIKLQEFQEMERHVRAERDRLQRQRQLVYADRITAAIASAAREQPSGPGAAVAGDAVVRDTVPPLHPGHQVVRSVPPSMQRQSLDRHHGGTLGTRSEATRAPTAPQSGYNAHPGNGPTQRRQPFQSKMSPGTYANEGAASSQSQTTPAQYIPGTVEAAQPGITPLAGVESPAQPQELAPNARHSGMSSHPAGSKNMTPLQSGGRVMQGPERSQHGMKADDAQLAKSGVTQVPAQARRRTLQTGQREPAVHSSVAMGNVNMNLAADRSMVAQSVSSLLPVEQRIVPSTAHGQPSLQQFDRMSASNAGQHNQVDLDGRTKLAGSLTDATLVANHASVGSARISPSPKLDGTPRIAAPNPRIGSGPSYLLPMEIDSSNVVGLSRMEFRPSDDGRNVAVNSSNQGPTSLAPSASTMRQALGYITPVSEPPASSYAVEAGFVPTREGSMGNGQDESKARRKQESTPMVPPSMVTALPGKGGAHLGEAGK